jgi:L-Ala-D/L-Glu epimerase
VRLNHRPATLRLNEPFTISRSTDVEVEEIFVELEASGLVGYGEASPQDIYGETVDSASAFLDEAEQLLGDDPFAFADIERRLAEMPGELAAKAALDSALHDLCGKLTGQPIWRLLGLDRAGPPTSWTIWLGDPDDMAQRTERVGRTFRRLKLKLGARRPRRRTRPRRALGDRSASPGRRERVLGARGGARERARARGAGRPVRGAATAGRSPRGVGACWRHAR